jgi:PST family polysaccharide transporter
MMVAMGPLLAWSFESPELKLIVAVMGLGFVMSSFGRVSTGLLERELRFDLLAKISIFTHVLAGGAAIGTALAGAGYWALVVQGLITVFLRSLLHLVAAGWLPRFEFQTAVVRRILSHSSGLTYFKLVNYWARNFDALLVGRVLGSSALGYYDRAYRLMIYPIKLINGALNLVLHPLLSRVQDDVPRMRRFYLKIVRVVAYLCMPLMAFLAMMAPEVVRVVWGEQWTQTVPIFAIFCLVGTVQPIGATFGAVFLARRRARLLAIIGTITTVVIVTGIALGIQNGMRGVAIGYSVAYAVVFLPTMYVVFCWLLEGRFRSILASLAKPSFTASAIASALWLFNQTFRGQWHDLAHVAAAGVVALIVYIGLFTLLDRDFLHEVNEVLPERFAAPIRRLLPGSPG